MTLLGIFSGILFVPLNALLQWRSPPDRRGAVIAMANVLVYAGMVLGTFLALVLARAGVSGRNTFLAASVVLAGGFAWSFWLVPENFLAVHPDRSIEGTLSRAGRRPGKHPGRGGAHCSYRTTCRLPTDFSCSPAPTGPSGFVIYASYFDRPVIGRLLRALKAIPISPSGGPKMILQAFREAGKALDDGELVCLFPEGQITRTGVMTPFQRGLERIVKGRTTPIIPMHLDRLSKSYLRAGQPPADAGQDPIPRHGFDRRATAAGCSAARDPLGDSRARDESLGLPQGRSPAVAPWVHPPSEKAPATAGVRRFFDAGALLYQGPDGLDRRSRGHSGNGGGVKPTWGSCCRPASGVPLVNLAATTGRQGRGEPQLHGRPRRHGIGRRAGRLEDGHHQPRVSR